MRFYFLIVKKNGIRVSKAYIFAPLEMTVTFGRRTGSVIRYLIQKRSIKKSTTRSFQLQAMCIVDV